MMIRLTSSDKGSITMRVRHLVIIRTPERGGGGSGHGCRYRCHVSLRQLTGQSRNSVHDDDRARPSKISDACNVN